MTSRIDILSGITGVTFGDAWSSRIQIAAGGLVLPVIGRAAFIENKLATGRERDRHDVALLESSADPE